MKKITNKKFNTIINECVSKALREGVEDQYSSDGSFLGDDEQDNGFDDQEIPNADSLEGYRSFGDIDMDPNNFESEGSLPSDMNDAEPEDGVTDSELSFEDDFFDIDLDNENNGVDDDDIAGMPVEEPSTINEAKKNFAKIYNRYFGKNFF